MIDLLEIEKSLVLPHIVARYSSLMHLLAVQQDAKISVQRMSILQPLAEI